MLDRRNAATVAAFAREATLVALPCNVGPAAARNVGLRRARRAHERSLVHDRKLVIGALSTEEESGAIRRATERYEEATRRRLAAAREIAR